IAVTLARSTARKSRRCPICLSDYLRGIYTSVLKSDFMGEGFTIRIYVVDGDPQGVRFIDRMNWTGLGIVFPRQKWPTTKLRNEFSRAGVYILVGYPGEEDELPTVYIGEGEVIRNRLDSHFQSK